MVIIGICLLVLFIGILKQRADLVLNFVVRMAAGAVAIVFCNQLLSKNVVEPDLIDAYIYEVNAMQLKYKFLLRRLKQKTEDSYAKNPLEVSDS